MTNIDLKELFVSTPPRETAGSTSASRFDFQRDVSLHKLLKAELTNQDYIFIFDYHEDLVVMDCEEKPEKVSFYQIKGKKSGNWTVKSLLKSEKGEDDKPLLSTLAKLYECRTKFEIETINLSFLSNARFNIKLADKSNANTLESICAVNLTDEDKTLMKKALNDQKVMEEGAELCEDMIFFEVVDVSVKDSAMHLKGMLAEFFQERYGISPDVNAIHRMFFAEIKQRGNYSHQINSFEDLLEKKSISKSKFTSWLSKIASNEQTLKEKWSELFSILTISGTSWETLAEIKKGWTRFELLSKDPSDVGFKKLIETVEVECAVNSSGVGLLEKATEIYSTVTAKINPAQNDKYTIMAIIFNKLY
jgi:hypothetical protein